MDATRRLATLKREQHAAIGMIAELRERPSVAIHHGVKCRRNRLQFWRAELARLKLAIAELSGILESRQQWK